MNLFLGHQDAGTTDLLDLPLCTGREELGLHNHGLLGQLALAQDLEDAVLGDINDRGGGGVLGGVLADLHGRTWRQEFAQ